MEVPNDIQRRFQVVRLEEGDIGSKTDHFNELRRLVLAHEGMYPDIEKWFRDKVCPGVRSTERAAFIGYLDEKPVVSAVVKRGEKAKFCHLHIEQGLREAHLGEIFFSLMAHEVRDLAQRVYFTLPESVWDEKNEFFRSFNFSNLNKANIQYRLFDEELECDAPFDSVWNAVATKLPKICNLYAWGANSLASDLLMSIRPKYADQIFSGKKRYELRRKFSTKWLGHRINIYATGHSMQLMGQAMAHRIIKNTPKEIWKQCGADLGCNHTEFEQYTQNTEEIYAIELSEVTPFRVPVSRKDIAEIFNESLNPPQSYCAVKPRVGWGKAVSLASFLQETFKGQILTPLHKLFSPRQSMIAKGSVAANFQLRKLLS